MAKLQFVLVVAVFFVISTQALVKDKCMEFIGKNPFQGEKMAGTWHVIAFASNHPEKQSNTCAKYEVRFYKSNDDDGFHVTYSALDKEKKVLSFDSVSKRFADGRLSVFYGAGKKADGVTYEGVLKQAIIVADYDNYAIYLGCRPTFDSITKEFGSSYEAAVVSRKPTLNEDIRDTLINVLSGYDIDPSDIKIMENKDCPQ